MKHLRRRASVWIAVVICVITIILILVFVQRINWNAVGAITSICAIIVAIFIPKRIADNQNKIALFEKRFEFYDTLSRCIMFRKMICNSSTSSAEIKKYFLSVFCNTNQPSLGIEYDYSLPIIEKIYENLWKGKFLFDIEMENEIKDLSLALLDITSGQEMIQDAWSNYMNAAKTVEDRILPAVTEALKLDF